MLVLISYILTIKTRLMCIYKNTSALHLVALRGWGTLCVRQRRLLTTRLTLINDKGEIISKYVCLIVKIDSARKTIKLTIFIF